MTKIKRSDFQPTDDGSTVVSWFRQFVLLKKQREALEKREKEVKTRISGYVEEHGYEDEKGHVLFDLPEPVEGFAHLKRERRQSRALDQDRAEALLRERGIYDDCTRTIVVLDEDAIMQAYYNEQLTEEDIDSMFNTKVTYAFVPVKE